MAEVKAPELRAFVDFVRGFGRVSLPPGKMERMTEVEFQTRLTHELRMARGIQGRVRDLIAERRLRNGQVPGVSPTVVGTLRCMIQKLLGENHAATDFANDSVAEMLLEFAASQELVEQPGNWTARTESKQAGVAWQPR